MNKKIILFSSVIVIMLVLIFAFLSCKDKNTYTIKGQLEGGENKFLVLMDLKGENPKVVDTIFLSSKGKFSKKESLKEKSLFILQADKSFITICPEKKEKIRIEGKFEDFASNYKIKGSKESEDLQLLAQRRIKFNNDFIEFQKQYNQASGKEKQYLFREYAMRSKQAFKEEKQFLSKYINDNKGKLSTIIALYTELLGEPLFSIQEDEQIYKIVLEGLEKTLPNNPNTLKIKNILTSSKQSKEK
ncbi:MAG: DUF4369 domain-containing protein [Bacteroidota bacterium]|nr:DUF4369 domain-containing protein [Bacteroidota bacterium]